MRCGEVILPSAWLVADMNCDGVANFADINCFVAAAGNCPPNPDPYACAPCDCLNGDLNGDGVVDFADINLFVGTIGAVGAQTQYSWDGENRLIGAEPSTATPPDGTQKAEYLYDYLGRRVQKRVWTYAGGSWGAPVVRRFVYAGWRIVLELDGDNQVVRKYTWGLDLAGQSGAFNSLKDAGGIAGLLAMSDPNDPNDPNDSFGEFAYFYDAHGNVGQVVDWAHDPNDPAGPLVAKYEYDAFGNITSQSGSYAAANPFRWSTKYFDPETGLSDSGGRYYHAGLGLVIGMEMGPRSARKTGPPTSIE
jgi:hypothetical protein